jgi:hypothetical protein
LNLWKERWYYLVFHWSITIIIWLIGALLVFIWLKKREILSNIFSFIESKNFSYKSFQIIKEFLCFQKIHGRNACILSIFQNIYYFFESSLIILIVAFFKRQESYGLI